MLRIAIALAVWCTAAGASAQVADIQPSPISIGRSYSLPSLIMEEAREINVWTPPGYATSQRAYPVLYVLDGGQAQDFHHISGLAQLGALVGTTQDVIVVGLATKDRRNELTTRARTDQTLTTDYPTHGERAKFQSFISDEVMPFIKTKYRVNGATTLMGESLAGLFTIETFLRSPHLFDHYVAISPSLWWDDGALVAEAEYLLAARHDDGATLWLTIADEGGEMQQAMDRLVAALRNHAPTVGFTYAPRPHESHTTIYHSAAQDALRQLYAVEAEQ